jgi:X-X-X-Leu-X-X-Gly heptad repeat protein
MGKSVNKIGRAAVIIAIALVSSLSVHECAGAQEASGLGITETDGGVALSLQAESASGAGDIPVSDTGDVTVSGEVSHKEEVVSASLSAGGEAREAYVVNILSVTKEGEVEDKGDYSSVKNLSTDAPIDIQAGGVIRVDAPEGDFYYQGNIEKPELPWLFALRYSLNGRELNPEALAGESGRLDIDIEVRKNEAVDSGWYDNCLLQISVTLDAALCRNIETEGGMVANAGGNKLVTFALMPGKGGAFSVGADVVDFSMPGIQISALPLEMNFERPDTSDMTEDMDKLADAISDLDDGAGDMLSGAGELSDGAEDLRDGMRKYVKGIDKLASESDKLKSGAKEIGAALSDLSKGLNALGAASGKLPGNISDSVGPAVANQLAPAVSAQLAPKIGLNAQQEQALSSALEQSLSQALPKALSPALAAALTAAPDKQNPHGSYGYQVKEAAKGAAKLSKGYSDSKPSKGFRSGLNAYLKGVSEAAKGGAKLDKGASLLADGISEFKSGVAELKDGTAKLSDETRDMPARIEEEIDEMIGEYDKSDYEPQSFASAENGVIGKIQFVITSEKIDKSEAEESAPEPGAKESILERFLDLFR